MTVKNAKKAFLTDNFWVTSLSETEQTAMMSGENAKIAVLFAEERVPLAITIVDPGPDPLPDPDPFPPSPPPDPEPDSD